MVESYLGFSHFLGIGPIKFNKLIQVFGSSDQAYSTSLQDFKKVIGSKTAEDFVVFRSEFNPKEKLEEIREKGIDIITREDNRYPKNFKNLEDSPICFYTKGNIENHKLDEDLGFAIVGTRKPTTYGEQIAKKMAYEVASCGFTIVSGLALGIDSLAHKAAIESNKKTIAILGCGVDVVYPPSNQKLYDEILRKDGLIISEFPPGMTTQKGLFIARNRLISALSKGVLVIEGEADSGALVTARFAAQQGKEVFAIPGPITSSKSQAPHILLKQGAKIVTSIEDILEEFNLTIKLSKKEEITEGLGGVEKKVFEKLINEAKTADEIAFELVIPIDNILQTLSTLEIKGLAGKNKEGKYEAVIW